MPSLLTVGLDSGRASLMSDSRVKVVSVFVEAAYG